MSWIFCVPSAVSYPIFFYFSSLFLLFVLLHTGNTCLLIYGFEFISVAANLDSLWSCFRSFTLTGSSSLNRKADDELCVGFGVCDYKVDWKAEDSLAPENFSIFLSWEKRPFLHISLLHIFLWMQHSFIFDCSFLFFIYTESSLPGGTFWRKMIISHHDLQMPRWGRYWFPTSPNAPRPTLALSVLTLSQRSSLEILWCSFW